MAEINVDQSTPLVPSIAHHNRRRDFRTNFQKKLAVFLIICSAGLERLAFYSLAGNLTFFLTSDNFKWRFPNQMIAVLIFLGKFVRFSFVLPFSSFHRDELHVCTIFFLG